MDPTLHLVAESLTLGNATLIIPLLVDALKAAVIGTASFLAPFPLDG